MLRYVYERDEAVANAVAQLVPNCERGFGRCKTIGVIDENGVLIAGVVFHNWQPEAGVIEMSAAALPGKRWLTRETIQTMYGYVFDICECQLVLSLVPSDDDRTLRMLASGGYKFVRVDRLLGRDRDATICTLTEEAWRANRFNKPRPEKLEEAA